MCRGVPGGFPSGECRPSSGRTGYGRFFVLIGAAFSLARIRRRGADNRFLFCRVGDISITLESSLLSPVVWCSGSQAFAATTSYHYCF